MGGLGLSIEHRGARFVVRRGLSTDEQVEIVKCLKEIMAVPRLDAMGVVRLLGCVRDVCDVGQGTQEDAARLLRRLRAPDGLADVQAVVDLMEMLKKVVSRFAC